MANTLDLLEGSRFSHDGSLMARDLVPYHPQRWQVVGSGKYREGPASRDSGNSC